MCTQGRLDEGLTRSMLFRKMKPESDVRNASPRASNPSKVGSMINIKIAYIISKCYGYRSNEGIGAECARHNIIRDMQ